MDTNIFVSFLLLKDSILTKAFSKAEKKGEIMLSNELFAEIATVLSRKKFDKYISKKIDMIFY